MSTIAVDFDGVIHGYSRGWGRGTIYDPPVDGALDALRALMEDYAVFIHTSRDPQQVATWLLSYGFTVSTDDVGVKFWDERGGLLITNRKLPALAYIDDRAIRFESWDQVFADFAELYG